MGCKKGKNLKIFLKILLFFILSALLICMGINIFLYLNNIYLSSDFDILSSITYFMGYTDLKAYSNTAKIVKFFFAISGLILTAIFSAFLTMHFIKSTKKINLNSHLLVTKDSIDKKSQYKISLDVESARFDLYQVCITFILYNHEGIVTESQEKKLSLLKKGLPSCISFDIEYNDPIFQYIFFKKNYLYKKLSLVCCVNYVSDYSGEQYFYCKEYDENTLLFDKLTIPTEAEKNDFFENIKQPEWNIYLNTYVPILSDVHNSKISRPDKTLPFKQIIKGSFNEYCVNWSFAMVLIRKPFYGNWLFFFDNDCSLEFKISNLTSSHLRLEIKNELQQHILDPSDPIYDLKNGNFSFKIRKLNSNRDDWRNVLELCFTVFNRNPIKMHNTQQDFNYILSNLKMVFPQNDQQEGRS